MTMLEAVPVALTPRPYWADDARCAGMAFELFFGRPDHALTPPEAMPGRAVCLVCPTRRDCLLDALVAGERAGLRGGFLPHERSNALRRNLGSVLGAMMDYDAGCFYQPRRRR